MLSRRLDNGVQLIVRGTSHRIRGQGGYRQGLSSGWRNLCDAKFRIDNAGRCCALPGWLRFRGCDTGQLRPGNAKAAFALHDFPTLGERQDYVIVSRRQRIGSERRNIGERITDVLGKLQRHLPHQLSIAQDLHFEHRQLRGSRIRMYQEKESCVFRSRHHLAGKAWNDLAVLIAERLKRIQLLGRWIDAPNQRNITQERTRGGIRDLEWPSFSAHLSAMAVDHGSFDREFTGREREMTLHGGTPKKHFLLRIERSTSRNILAEMLNHRPGLILDFRNYR